MSTYYVLALGYRVPEGGEAQFLPSAGVFCAVLPSTRSLLGEVGSLLAASRHVESSET